MYQEPARWWGTVAVWIAVASFAPPWGRSGALARARVRPEGARRQPGTARSNTLRGLGGTGRQRALAATDGGALFALPDGGWPRFVGSSQARWPASLRADRSQ